MKLSTAAVSMALLKSFALAEVDSGALEAARQCNLDFGPLKFLLLEDEAVNAAIEDDIRRDLLKIGFDVQAKSLSKAELNIARQSGDFHFTLSETWGTPYDPFSFASGWIDGSGGEGAYPAMVNFQKPASRQILLDMVGEVLQLESRSALQAKWNEIHNYYHSQAVLMPLYGKRIPTLLNSRLSGYQPGYQQFDYPVHKLKPSGSSTVTIAPGARSGLFKTVGTMNAHVYGPNEFFSNNWVYEGLVSYGPNGDILGAMAMTYDVKPNNIGGDTYTFQLRPGVTFHDGEVWNCAAAKLNFDHIFAGGLAAEKHSWYGVGKYTEDWMCNNDMEFQIRTNFKHGPYVQELTLIRPIRMISPKAFVNATDPLNSNSCHLDWGTIDHLDYQEDIICAGIQDIAGTGPFKYESKETSEGIDTKVIFTAHEGYWDGASAVKRLEIIHYISSEAVKEALMKQELDVVWGAGVLSNADIEEISIDDSLQSNINVFYSGPVQNVILILNSGMPPFDDINVRKTVIHAINKATIVENELRGQEVVNNVFPLQAPYCNVDLTPKWDYDLEKAVLLSCGGTLNVRKKDNSKLAFGLAFGLGALVLVAGIFAVSLFKKNQKLTEELELTQKAGAVEA